ncbi:PAS domain S-box-containing protein [Breznakibacter xylanolyticus]|uniref:PAS domain S-box-containing protein n=1 Tax=Breznakibacter xylanolyticus TaxID=990 RepID=A0A2W7N6D2_9BACT|nr:response regulator [Breznakibacter xylanolyticus]PZX12414.1 PAS domain S-box-containing protein [Breznakibacter xylanolyticus]
MRRVLIVEDDRFISSIFKLFLSELGHEIVGRCENGEKALELCHELKPDVVLMDVHLQGDIDGIRTADRLRSELDIPVIYISGDTSTEVIERAIVSNSYGYLVKPINKKELGISIDLAYYKHKVDKEQRGREKSYREFISELPIPIVIVHQGKIKYLNLLALEKIMRTTYIEDVMGIPFSTFVAPESREAIHQILEIEKDATRKCTNELVVLRDLHGQSLYAEVSAAAVYFNNKQAVQLMIRDVSGQVFLRQQSDFLQSLLLNSDKPLVMLDKNFHLLAKNNAAEALIPSLTAVQTGQVPEELKQVISAACLAGFENYDLRIGLQTKAGHDVKLRCVGLCDGHGTVCRWGITQAD